MDENNVIGKEIGNYCIIAEINSGAFGSVYKAEHTHLKGRIVAIKLLHTYLGSIKEREQFTQEAQFLALLEHAHILPLLDFGFSGHQPYLIARYATGGSLRNLLKRQSPLPVAQAVNILIQVGQALGYAHDRNIIHRDLKPENILFNEQGEAVLADFGIATMLSTASVKHLTTIEGTPPYMAPEQFQGIVSKSGDQYALGCIAYELVTGRVPFTAPDFLSMGFKHLTEEPIIPTHHNPQVPVETSAAILKAMAKQRTERHADIPAFLEALQVPLTQPTELRSAAPIQPAVLSSAEATSTTTSLARTKEQWRDVGNGHRSAGRYAEALAAYEQAIRLDPNYAPTYFGKGEALYNLKRSEEALRAYEQAIRLNPNYVYAHFGRGQALYDLKRYGEALRAYEQVIRLNPNYVYAYFGKGQALYNLKYPEEALRAYWQAVHLNPNYAPAYNNIGIALRDLQQYGEALRAYEQAIRLDPNYAPAYNNIGVVLRDLQRYEEALSACEQAIRLNPNYAPAYNNKGIALRTLKRYEEALSAYEQAIRLNPNDTSAYNNKGVVLRALKRYEEALSAYEQAIHLNPNDALAYNNMASALDALGRVNEAQQAREKARQLRNG